jgi:excisionase family DNA binding protein
VTTQALLRPHEVCDMLGVSRSWLYQAAADGRIPHVRPGSDDGPIRFLASDIEQWFEDAQLRWPGRGRPDVNGIDVSALVNEMDVAALLNGLAAWVVAEARAHRISHAWGRAC